MAQTIITKNGTLSTGPTSLTKGELALNTDSGSLYYGDTAGAVSNDFTFGEVTASQFVGGGAGITGVTAEWDGTHTGTADFTGDITASGNISASGNIYSDNEQYFSTTGRLVIPDNTTHYAGPNAQGVNYYYWNRNLGTDALVISAKTSTLNSGWKLPYKAILTGYHLNIQGRSTNDDIEFTLVYCDGMWDGDVTSTSQTLVAAESGQTITITTANNFYELDRRDQFQIPVSAMTMIYPRFRKTSTTAGTTNYDFQLAIQYRIAK